MPRYATTSKDKVVKAIGKYGQSVFESIYDSKSKQYILWCKVCAKSVAHDNNSLIRQHTSSKTHKNGLTSDPTASSSSSVGRAQAGQLPADYAFRLATDQAEVREAFQTELCEVFLCADIPLFKLRNERLVNFLEKHTKQKVPCETTLRKRSVETVYNSTINRIRAALKDKDLYIMMDETTDAQKRFVVNVIVGALGEDSTPFLVHMEHVQRADSAEMTLVFGRALQKIFGERIVRDRVLLFVSDGAAYMKLCGEILKRTYTSMVHVTCIAHAAHRLAEAVRERYPKVNELIANVKKVFKKSPGRVAEFQRVAPHVPLPPEPIVTRWGTWLAAIDYYWSNIEYVAKALDELNETDARCISSAKLIIRDPEIYGQLDNIRANYGWIPNMILTFEKRNCPLRESIGRIDAAVAFLEGAAGVIAADMRIKFSELLQNNPGLQTLRDLDALHTGDTNQTIHGYSFSPRQISAFRYSPVVSCDVERSFSKYRAIFRENRMSFDFDNLVQHTIVYCNP